MMNTVPRALVERTRGVSCKPPQGESIKVDKPNQITRGIEPKSPTSNSPEGKLASARDGRPNTAQNSTPSVQQLLAFTNSGEKKLVKVRPPESDEYRKQSADSLPPSVRKVPGGNVKTSEEGQLQMSESGKHVIQNAIKPLQAKTRSGRTVSPVEKLTYNVHGKRETVSENHEDGPDNV